MAFKLGENWDLGVLTWKRVENSEQNMLQFYLLRNANNLNKSKPLSSFPWAITSSAHIISTVTGEASLQGLVSPSQL